MKRPSITIWVRVFLVLIGLPMLIPAGIIVHLFYGFYFVGEGPLWMGIPIGLISVSFFSIPGVLVIFTGIVEDKHYQFSARILILGFAVVSIILLPVALPLLIAWNKPQVKEYYASLRNSADPES